MKARIRWDKEQESMRKKGRELIDNLRDKGWSDDKIAESLGVPYSKWKQFLINIGMNPFVKHHKKEE